ncbi:hypothetical protein [Nostoc sp. LPT]|uniref:hypothetical protein n=1 Tax=Nostoc sp. LPT TaxID=2815387 RepID=UPI0025D78191|nr:hypothetical protein [Nostoc sp. LPT]
MRSCGDVGQSIFPPSRGQRVLGSSASTLHRRGQAVTRRGQKASFPAVIGVEFPISLVNPRLVIVQFIFVYYVVSTSVLIVLFK